MKICVISYHSCPYTLLGGEDTGGMSVYIKEIAAALTAFPGAEVDVFTRASNIQSSGIKEISSGIRMVYLKAGPLRMAGRNEALDHIPEFIKNLKQFILAKGEDYKLVYSHYWLSGLIGKQIKKAFSLPLVHMYHTLGFLKDKVLAEKEYNYRLNAEKEVADFSDLIISSSYEEKSDLIREYDIPSSKVKVISPGVNRDVFQPWYDDQVFEEVGIPRKQKILLFVGRIQPVKGLVTLIEAMKVLRQQKSLLFEQLRVLVVGGGKQDFDLKKNKEYLSILETIRQAKLGDYVKFLGSKEQLELKRYYSIADALVVPSVYESFGLVVIEAMACGTPVIASRIGKIKSIIDEGYSGSTFSPKDAQSLAEQLVRFYAKKDSFWPPEMIRENIISQYSWEEAARKTYRLFLDLQAVEFYPTTIFRPGENPQPA
jgi:D-inositol-3-phosphate glycosyltransferase